MCWDYVFLDFCADYTQKSISTVSNFTLYNMLVLQIVYVFERQRITKNVKQYNH